MYDQTFKLGQRYDYRAKEYHYVSGIWQFDGGYLFYDSQTLAKALEEYSSRAEVTVYHHPATSSPLRYLHRLRFRDRAKFS